MTHLDRVIGDHVQLGVPLPTNEDFDAFQHTLEEHRASSRNLFRKWQIRATQRTLEELRRQINGEFAHFDESDGSGVLTPATKPTIRLSAAPGHHLLTISEFLFSDRSLEEILRPTIEDMRREYNDALADDSRLKAKWVRVRGTWSFLGAAWMIAFASFGKAMVRMWRLIP